LPLYIHEGPESVSYGNVNNLFNSVTNDNLKITLAGDHLHLI